MWPFSLRPLLLPPTAATARVVGGSSGSSSCRGGGSGTSGTASFLQRAVFGLFGSCKPHHFGQHPITAPRHPLASAPRAARPALCPSLSLFPSHLPSQK
ncbi:hypothetical protein BDY21DRAFT_67089 [Lineolata rhizophorae]|uniref:Secreted protein n=1 Tax=Lineolata rhizophorae TaxID=578093 RepID=A0A6A6NUQ1_9PEZI|nr:hypothetical protein BDY21DRAFT_67089 [Lineolata rhizophorae]